MMTTQSNAHIKRQAYKGVITSEIRLNPPKVERNTSQITGFREQKHSTAICKCFFL